MKFSISLSHPPNAHFFVENLVFSSNPVEHSENFPEGLSFVACILKCGHLNHNEHLN